MTDFRKFLGKTDIRVMPHFGGASVEAPDRKLRLKEPVALGWWRFEVKGRNAVALERAEPEISALENLPSVRGHLLGDRLVMNGAVAEPIFFLPADEPARFSPIKARRWPRGQLIFEAVEFESEVEEAVRRALEDHRSLAEERSVPATLRAAFGYAIAIEVARRLRVPLSCSEVAPCVVEIAEHADGRVIVEAMLQALVRERQEHERLVALRRQTEGARERARVVQAARAKMDVRDRVEEALDAAGAELLDLRRLEDALVEATYRFMGERFLTIVHRDTLRVVDAGVCLAGHDDDVTLESLPSVIRQAIAERRLVITRRAAQDARGRYHWERELVDNDDA